ncbi:MAG: MBL fold metallo-hydrolase [Bacteroidota bacterium]
MRNLIYLWCVLVTLTACQNQNTASQNEETVKTSPEKEVENPNYSHQGMPVVDVLYDGYVQPIEGKEPSPGVDPEGARKVASTISLIRTEDMVIVADPGMTAKGTWDGIISQMKGLGVEAEAVTHVFISHHHPDHTTRVGAFPNATVVDFWATYKDDVWSDHPDGYEMTKGVKVVQTPGHTEQDASLLVETEEGLYFLTHLWWNDQFAPKTDRLAEDPEALEENRKEWITQVDWIVPGHGKKFKNPNKK